MGLGWIGNLIFWIFFLYGLVTFILKILYEFSFGNKKKLEDEKILLIVKNQERNIEVVLRTLDYYGVEVDVEDHGSLDHTPDIVRKLSNDLDRVHFMDG